MEKEYDLWSMAVKPAAVVLTIIIVVFIIQAIFNFSSMFRWILVVILSLLWLAYYYIFEFRTDLPARDEEMPDEV